MDQCPELIDLYDTYNVYVNVAIESEDNVK